MKELPSIIVLRLYRFDGKYLEFNLGKKTDAGIIRDIFQLPSGAWIIDYVGGKHAVLMGFNGYSALYNPPR